MPLDAGNTAMYGLSMDQVRLANATLSISNARSVLLGNVLAHASYPKDGRIHFDEDEQWIIEDPSRLKDDPAVVDFYTVAVHEIGHALGVQHLRQQEAIMYPIYMPPDVGPDGRVKPLKLSQYDIEAIERLYGTA